MSVVSIQGYQFDKSEMRNSPNGAWVKAVCGGQEFFLKKFTQPKFPRDGASPALYASKKKECDEWLSAKKRLISALNELGNGTGNIISPRDIFREELCFYQATCWIDVQTDSLDKIKNYAPDMKIMILKTYSAALKKVHSKNIIHGDLKPENILIGKSASGKPVAKLIDFDDSYFSKEALSPDLTIATDGYQSPELAAYKAGREQLRDRLTCASDVFASGIIFHQFWTGRMPKYKGENDGRFLYEAIIDGDGYKLDASLPEWLQNLLHAMLALKPEDRVTMEEVHEAISNKHFDRVVKEVEPKKHNDPKPGPKPVEPAKPVETDDILSKKMEEWQKISMIQEQVPNDLENYEPSSLAELKKAIRLLEGMNEDTPLPKVVETRKQLAKGVLSLKKKQKSLANIATLEKLLKDVPTDLSKYTTESCDELKRCLAQIEKNKYIAPQQVIDSLCRRLTRTISNLKIKDSDTSGDVKFGMKVLTPLPSGFKKVEIISESKVRVYMEDSHSASLTLSKFAAEGMGLIKIL